MQRYFIEPKCTKDGSVAESENKTGGHNNFFSHPCQGCLFLISGSLFFPASHSLVLPDLLFTAPFSAALAHAPPLLPAGLITYDS